MNIENFNQWIARLRSGEVEQVQGRLGLGDRRCCLGVGSDLSGCEVVEGSEGERLYGRARKDNLMPVETVEWFGLEVPPIENVWSEGYDPRGFDLFVDWPEDMRFRAGKDYPTAELTADDADVASGATLNDSPFTFAQIADIFAYWGCRGVK
jgi:hypothetical protein